MMQAEVSEMVQDNMIGASNHIRSPAVTSQSETWEACMPRASMNINSPPLVM